MRGDLGTRSVVIAVITKMILCVSAAKRNLISRFVAIDLVNELARHFYSALTCITILLCFSWTRFH